MQCQLQLLHQKQCRQLLVDWIWYLAGNPKRLYEHLLRMICAWVFVVKSRQGLENAMFWHGDSVC
jgi:hypothetical protein